MKKVFTRLYACLLCIGGIVFACSTTAKAYIPAGVRGAYISREYVIQEKTNWCWAACAENACIAENMRIYSQWDAVNTIKGTTSDAYPNQMGTSTDIKNAVAKISNDSLAYSVYGVKAYDDIANMIYQGYPIIATTGVYSSNNYRLYGHAVLIVGWNNDGGTSRISYIDPIDAKNVVCTYAGFCDGTETLLKYEGSVCR